METELLQKISELERKVKELESEKFNHNVTQRNEVEKEDLSNQEIRRYGRQMILPEIGREGQIKLKNASVLVVGGGGLGSPVALYLAAAGVGKLGIVDYDLVDLSNLHRQVIHSEATLGISKAKSACDAAQRINSSIQCVPHEVLINSINAMHLIEQYSIVVDCSDNVATRYLLNDACILLNRPLVSGAALRTDGQLTVYNYNQGPCFRCLFPDPPPPESVTDCANGGVLGVVTGTIGSLQALEVIKIVCGFGDILSQKLLLFDAVNARFRTIKLRGKNPACAICGENPSVKALIDYEVFCKSKADDKIRVQDILPPEDHISPHDLHQLQSQDADVLLLDVRAPVQYSICRLPRSHNVPLESIKEKLGELRQQAAQRPVVVLCRRGEDSQTALQILREHGFSDLKNLQGGLLNYAQFDPSFPIY
eukprot:TRINITY_DN5211_c0_g1_i1.p1 TRINITY_DN5211_c0_g1~~TRINITY_DN5211_c0_g1_i1.p1  ORF type:complete len:424 (+),score=85.81 TRINITY_DN5211_c0_g1_i1:2-1273(+)